MSDQRNFLNLLSATSSQELASGATHSGVRDGTMTDRSGRDPVRASLSAGQAKERGLLTSGTYSQTGSTSSASADLQRSLENRLRVKTALVGSTLYKLTWKERATPLHRSILCCGLRAPHIRQRLWFVAHSDHSGSQGRISGWTHSERQDQHGYIGCDGTVSGMDNAIGIGRDAGRHGNYGGDVRIEFDATVEDGGSRMADPECDQQRSGRGPDAKVKRG